MYDSKVDPDAILFPTGSKQGKLWVWTLRAPLPVMHKAGVEFDPNVRNVASVQGEVAHGSALKVGQG